MISPQLADDLARLLDVFAIARATGVPVMFAPLVMERKRFDGPTLLLCRDVPGFVVLGCHSCAYLLDSFANGNELHGEPVCPPCWEHAPETERERRERRG